MRRPANRQKPRLARPHSTPAPTSGWIANLNLAQPNAKNADGSPVSGASVMDNMFPTATSAVLFRGSELYATLGNGTLPVTSLFSYVAGNKQELFAANETTIYDITVVTNASNSILINEDDDYISPDPGADLAFGWSSTEDLDVVTGQAGGDWVVVQFATAGGTFLRGVNGEDTPFVYDGTSFEVTPAMTFASPDGAKDPSVLSYVWAYKNRLWFIEKDTLDAWYLPVDQVGGELVKFPLGGVFGKGGALMFGATWSNDAGEQGGLSEQIIFVTTEGEVAVYQGSNPADAADWGKVGVYSIGRPLGHKAHIKAGGDVVIATSVGFVGVSQAVRKDFAALAPSAVSFPIEVAWNEAVDFRSGGAWHCEVWANKQMAVIALPTINQQPPAMYIANVRTGAWCRRLNWDGTCLEVFKDRLFFGSVDGKVVEANVTGLDEGAPYTGVIVPLFSDFGNPLADKIVESVCAVVLAPTVVGVQVSMQSNFTVSLPPAPDAFPVPVGNEWGNAIWGISLWGGAPTKKQQAFWRTPYGDCLGTALSPAVQITSGSIVPVDAELVRIDSTYTMADLIS